MSGARAALICELFDLLDLQRAEVTDLKTQIRGIESRPTPKAGADGRGIDSVHVDENGDLIVRYTDGSKQNAGHVRGKIALLPG